MLGPLNCEPHSFLGTRFSLFGHLYCFLTPDLFSSVFSQELRF